MSAVCLLLSAICLLLKSQVPVLETPFLAHLNLSHNKISVLNDVILDKPSSLQVGVLLVSCCFTYLQLFVYF